MRGLPQKPVDRAPAAPPPAPLSLTREEVAKRLVGQVATFYAKPGSVVRMLAVPGAKLYVGQIIAAEFAGLRGKGEVPDYKVTIRGRTGKTAIVSTFDHYVRPFDTWKEAITHSEAT
jgi:hypothetical protein